MKLPSVLLPAVLVAAFSVSAAEIPADLAARADALRAQASPQVLSWVKDQGRALASARGPVDVAALEQSVRARFVTRRVRTAGGAGVTYPNLGATGDGDIMALCFIVMMEAAKSAQEDLKAIMDGVKAINKDKEGWRAVSNTVNSSAAHAQTSTSTPTPVPDRSAQLLRAARSTADKIHSANLSHVVSR